MTRRRRGSPFWSVVIALAAVWLLLDHGLPYLTMWTTGTDRPLPIPGAVRLIYLALAVVGAVVYVTISDESMKDFLRPVVAGIMGPDPAAPHARWLRATRLGLLLGIPLVAGGFVYTQVAPKIGSPTVLRIQHPTVPGAYERLQNPFREPPEDAVRKWMADRKFSGSAEEARRALVDAALAEGREVF